MSDNLEETAQRFLQLATRLRRLGSGAPALDDAQISPSHLALLEYVAISPGCGIQEIASGLQLATPTVSISVRQLEKNGLITRQPNPEDGRAVQIFLTPEGECVYRRAHAFHRRKFEKILSGLPPDDRETLVGLLEQAINTAEHDTPDEEPAR